MTSVQSEQYDGRHFWLKKYVRGVVLANGAFVQANCCTEQQALLNASDLTRISTGAGEFDPNDEEGWTLLPNGQVLTVEAYVPLGGFSSRALCSMQKNGHHAAIVLPR